MDKKKELGTGFIEEACRAAGVTRGTYYNAKKRLKNNKALSLAQLKVLKHYDTILKEAEENLQTIRSNQS